MSVADREEKDNRVYHNNIIMFTKYIHGGYLKLICMNSLLPSHAFLNNYLLMSY